jgi:hypothetical protein
MVAINYKVNVTSSDKDFNSLRDGVLNPRPIAFVNFSKRAALCAGFIFAELLCGVSLVRAEDVGSKRSAAERELSGYFRKNVVLELDLANVKGPAEIGSLRGRSIAGCPPQPIVFASDKKSMSLRTGTAGAWAGDLDGVNLSLTTADGKRGAGLAVPSNSTGRPSAANGNPELQISFDGMANVVRGIADVIGDNALSCLDSLPPGEYTGDEMAQRCGVMYPTRQEVGQTCVLVSEGAVGKPSADGASYQATLRDMTLCNFVNLGFGESPIFTTCYVHEYVGKATIKDEFAPVAQAAAVVSQAKREATNKCRNLGRKMDSKRSSKKVVRCVNDRVRRNIKTISRQ